MVISKLDNWKELIAEWQESGKTRKEFRLEKNLSITFLGNQTCNSGGFLLQLGGRTFILP